MATLVQLVALAEALAIVEEHVDGCSAYVVELAVSLSLAEALADLRSSRERNAAGVNGGAARRRVAAAPCSVTTTMVHIRHMLGLPWSAYLLAQPIPFGAWRLLCQPFGVLECFSLQQETCLACCLSVGHKVY